jgi:hypothetical protein
MVSENSYLNKHTEFVHRSPYSDIFSVDETGLD